MSSSTVIVVPRYSSALHRDFLSSLDIIMSLAVHFTWPDDMDIFHLPIGVVCIFGFSGILWWLDWHSFHC